MTAVGELVLVLGLLVSAHCEVRARDPEVEEEEELGGRAASRGGRRGPGVGGFDTSVFPPHLERLHPRATETPPVGERDNHPTRTGNWCAFVQERVVTMAVICGTEKYTIKSQSPCPSGIPDCQVVMYKLSTRPVYTQRQKILTALHWRCCPGHGGNNCEDTVPDPQLDSGTLALTAGSEPERTDPRGPDELMRLQQQWHQGDQSHQQDNDQTSISNSTHPAREPGHAHNPLHTSHHATNTNHPHPHPHPHHPHQQQEHLSAALDPAALPYPEAPAALPVPHMMALVMSQLQPVLQGFNRSLEHLSQQVWDLAHDVALLKRSQRGPELPAGPLEGPELDEAAEERLEARLDEVFQNIREVRRQMESQQTDMENRLHSQHAMLHYNLTSVKTDIDMKLKRQQQMLQVSLQAVNTTQSELKLDEDQTTEAQLDLHFPFPSLPPPRPPQPSDSSTLWEAIERLDNMVVNNTVKVNGLMEDVEVTSGNVQQLRRDCKELERQLNQTARNSQILFMETGLEVEDAKVVVLKRVEELAGNLTQHNKQLQDMEEDVDYLYTALYHNHSATDCDCKGLKATLVRLERGVANVTALAHENRIALDKNGEGGAEHWSEASDREQAVVEALQRDLHAAGAAGAWVEELVRQRERRGDDDERPGGCVDGQPDAVGQQLLREPVWVRVGRVQEPCGCVAVAARRWGSARRGARCARPGAAAPPDDADVRPGASHGPRVRGDQPPLLEGPPRLCRHLCTRVVQADAPRHGAACAVRRGACSGGAVHLAGPRAGGKRPGGGVCGARCAVVEDPGERPHDRGARPRRVGVGVDVPRHRQARRRERRARAACAAERLGGERPGGAGQGARRAGAHPRRAQRGQRSQGVARGPDCACRRRRHRGGGGQGWHAGGSAIPRRADGRDGGRDRRGVICGAGAGDRRLPQPPRDDRRPAGGADDGGARAPADADLCGDDGAGRRASGAGMQHRRHCARCAHGAPGRAEHRLLQEPARHGDGVEPPARRGGPVRGPVPQVGRRQVDGDARGPPVWVELAAACRCGGVRGGRGGRQVRGRLCCGVGQSDGPRPLRLPVVWRRPTGAWARRRRTAVGDGVVT